MFEHNTSVAVHVNTEKGLEFRAYIRTSTAGETYLVFSIGDVTFFVNDILVAAELTRALSSNLRLCLERWSAENPTPTPQPASV